MATRTAALPPCLSTDTLTLATNCLNVYDVTDPSSPSLLSSVDGAGDHTSECVLDCSYFYGDGGTIVDARDPANAEIAGNWVTHLQDQGYEIQSTHATREVAPGYIVTSTQPAYLLSVNAKEGGTPLEPVVLATGLNDDGRFIHSAEWPRDGRDRFMLLGGETVLNAEQCSDESAAFMTWDSTAVVDPAGGYFAGSQWSLVDEIRMRNGTFSDSYSPYNIFGCSVHWFQEHPAFRNGGIVAVSAYEHGTRLFQVTPEGKIVEQGFALPLAGAASAPHWHPSGQYFYTIDYQRGMDIWEYSGEAFQGPPDDAPAPPAGGGTPPGGDPGALQLRVSGPSRARVRAVRRRGLTITATCSRTCDLSARLKRGRRTVAGASRRGATGATKLRLRVSRRAARRVKRGSYKLTVSARSADGRGAKAVKRIRLR